MVADHLSPDARVVLHTENGMLGIGQPQAAATSIQTS
jgi:acyl CoA:acetate/3-ketoacid CoA transferase beta subunit